MALQISTALTLNVLIIYPKAGTTPIEQLSDCYRQFTENSKGKINFKTSVVKQSLFISSENNTEYIQSKQNLLACAKNFFVQIPPTSIIAQSPENGSLVLEFTIIDGIQANEITHHRYEDSTWILFNRESVKMLFATGHSQNSETGDILLQSNTAFTQVQKILEAEKMQFSDVIRQWNYIEQITKTVSHNNSVSQHYQVFNDVRSKFYQQSDFINGYPSATGIGCDTGGIIIDVIAMKSVGNDSVIPIKSPVQLDAYTYSKEVLAENNTMTDFCRTTPKFERAKVLSSDGNKTIFISGTAAIKGQVSIPVISPAMQTEMTIHNIQSLISRENLRKHGLSPDKEPTIHNLRVYVKYRKDLQEVKEICMKQFPGIPVVYVFADICRPELLVEIEGLASVV